MASTSVRPGTIFRWQMSSRHLASRCRPLLTGGATAASRSNLVWLMRRVDEPTGVQRFTPGGRPESDILDADCLEESSGLWLGRRWFIAGAALLPLQGMMSADAEAAAASDSLQTYKDETNKFSLELPANFEKKDKAGATALFVDPERGSTQVGVTVNPVRIASLTAFGSLEDVGEKLLNAERAKESTLECTLIYQQTRPSDGGIVYYEYGYELNSTRGRKNVQTAVTIQDSVLYIVNAAVKCDKETCSGYEDTIATLQQVTQSFGVL